MKRSELKQIIKEEIVKILSEAEIMNKRDDANPEYQYRNIIKFQPYFDGKDFYAQIIGFFVDNNRIDRYHVRTFSTNDKNSTTSLGKYTEDELKKLKAEKIDDNNSEIANTIKQHPKYVKY